MKYILVLITIILLYLVYAKVNYVEEEPYTESQYLAEYGTAQQQQQLKAKNQKKLILLSTTWCGACKSAKKDLKANGINFIEYDAEKSNKGKNLMRQYKGKGYPTLIIGEESFTGYSRQWVQQRL